MLSKHKLVAPILGYIVPMQAWIAYKPRHTMTNTIRTVHYCVTYACESLAIYEAVLNVDITGERLKI